MNPLILTGAYGKKYNTRTEAARDWAREKDFQIYPNGPYCSLRDSATLASNYDCVTILIANGEPYKASL